VDAEQSNYDRDIIFKYCLVIIPYLFYILVIFLIFRFFGKEPKVDYEGIYERELPTHDSPDLINAIVRNIAKNVDNEGIQAVIMDLYRRDYIYFDDSYKVIKFKKQDPGSELSLSERKFFLFLKCYDDDGFSFDKLKKKMTKSQLFARKFNKKFENYKSFMRSEVREKGYFHTQGYYMSVFFSILILIASAVIPAYVSNNTPPLLQNISYIISIFSWFTAAVIILLPRDVFGQWTKSGRIFYLKWLNFGKFIAEFSMLSDYPPESVVVWEEYLVYATALGIAAVSYTHLRAHET